MTKTLCRGKGRRGIPAGSRPYHLLISYVSLNFSFAASDDTIIPLKPIDLMVERRTIQSCLTILFSSPSAKNYQPWDSYIFPPEVVQLVFLDVKACAGDVQAATSLNAKTDLATKHSHSVNLRFLQRNGAVFNVLPSTPQLFDAEDVSFINVEIKGVSSLTINVFAIEYAFSTQNLDLKSSCFAGTKIIAKQETLSWTQPSR